MSKTYTVKVGEVVGVGVNRRALNLLPVEGVDAALAAELEAGGWRRDGRRLVSELGNATAIVDLDAREVRVEARAVRDVVGSGYDHADDEERGTALARRNAEANRAGTLAAAQAAADEAVAHEAERVRRTLVDAVARANVTAIEAKARRMGRVIREERGVVNGVPTVTIKVEV